MANFFTSFATGGLKAATNNMYRVAEQRGAYLDDLRPKIEEKFNLLNNTTKKYQDIYKKVSKFDGGQSAFNYFFDRGDIDTALDVDEAAKYIMDNANMIPKNYSAGDNISGEERITTAYQSGVDTINNYINDVGTKNKLGDSTKNLLLTQNNPMLESFKTQMQVPTKVVPYGSGVISGTVADKKNDLIMNTSKINAYVSTVLQRQPTMEDYTNPDIAEASGATALTQRDIPLLRDAIGEKDYFKEAMNDGVAQFIANTLPQYQMEGEMQVQALDRIFNTVNSIYDYIDVKEGQATGGGGTPFRTSEGVSWEDIPLNSEFTTGNKTYRKVGIEPNDSSIEIVG
jgi:hypothetical protein